MSILKKIIIWMTPNGIYQYYLKRNNFFHKKFENIQKLPRYTKGTIDIPSHKSFKFVDNLSFIAQYKDIFQNEIYYFNNYNNNSPVIIDAGANIGLAIVYWKNLYPNSKIIGFEPDNEVFDVLKNNVSVYKNIEIYNFGLYSHDTKLSFMSEGSDSGSIVHGNDINRTANTEILVKKLSPYINGKIDLLKIDIEGAEFEVLKECSDFLVNVDRIFVEYHSFLGKEQVLPELLQILKNAGFRFKLYSINVLTKAPFENDPNYLGMDLQINIFGKRQRNNHS